MKILLIGEYSRLHNSLKEGLVKLNHQVMIYGLNDGFKNYPVDFLIKRPWNTGFLKKIKVIIYKLTGFDITSYLTYKRFEQNIENFSGFDVVQLINENSFLCLPKYEIKIIDYLLKKNKKIFLLSCGHDFLNVKYLFDNSTKKSALTPFFENKIEEKDLSNLFKFKKKSFEKLHHFIYKNINGVIASDLDYHFPLLGNNHYLGLIPNAINTDKLIFEEIKSIEKTIIFFGINNESYYKKGSDYFEKALEVIEKKYKQKVEIIKTKNVQYKNYIDSYNKCHILLDQTYALDQGYNALEAMAKGKVVFTGAGKEFINHYKLDHIVAINAIDDVDYLVNELSYLIENPNQIIEIGKRAKAFIEKEHNYINIAKKYIKTWSDN